MELRGSKSAASGPKKKRKRKEKKLKKRHLSFLDIIRKQKENKNKTKIKHKYESLSKTVVCCQRWFFVLFLFCFFVVVVNRFGVSTYPKKKWGQKHPLFGEGIVILKKKRRKEKKKKLEKQENWRARVDGEGAKELKEPIEE